MRGIRENLGGKRKPNGAYGFKMGGNKPSGHHGIFNNVDILLALSVSHGALDSAKTKMELVKEVLNICSPFKWSGFLTLFVFFSLLL